MYFAVSLPLFKQARCLKPKGINPQTALTSPGIIQGREMNPSKGILRVNTFGQRWFKYPERTHGCLVYLHRWLMALMGFHGTMCNRPMDPLGWILLTFSAKRCKCRILEIPVFSAWLKGRKLGVIKPVVSLLKICIFQGSSTWMWPWFYLNVESISEDLWCWKIQ